MNFLAKPLGPVAIAAAVMLAALPCLADLSWQETVSVTLQVDGRQQTLSSSVRSYSLKRNLLRIDELQSPTFQLINLQNQTVVKVDMGAKSFEVLPFSHLARETRQNREQIARELPRQTAALESLPPDQRQIMAAQIEAQRLKYQLWSRPYAVEATEERGTINGLPAVKYVGKAGGEIFQEIWVLEREVDPFFKKYFAPGMALLDNQEFAHLTEVPGFALRVVYHYGPVTVTRDATNFSDSKVEAQAFMLPQDARLSENTMLPR